MEVYVSNWLALHGFLGHYSQWKFLEQLGKVTAIDLYKLMHLSKEQLLNNVLDNVKDNTNLIGYSMGGRIAMELFLLAPEKFSSLYLLASHPGLECKDEIQKRILWEKNWIDKLKSLNRDDFLNEWNAQDIFINDLPIDFFDASIEQMIACFEIWGLSKQKFLINDLKKYKDKVIWIIGSEDINYKRITATSIKEHFYTYCVTGAGHRLLQHPESLLNCLNLLNRN